MMCHGHIIARATRGAWPLSLGTTTTTLFLIPK